MVIVDIKAGSCAKPTQKEIRFKKTRSKRER